MVSLEHHRGKATQEEDVVEGKRIKHPLLPCYFSIPNPTLKLVSTHKLVLKSVLTSFTFVATFSHVKASPRLATMLIHITTAPPLFFLPRVQHPGFINTEAPRGLLKLHIGKNTQHDFLWWPLPCRYKEPKLPPLLPVLAQACSKECDASVPLRVRAWMG